MSGRWAEIQCPYLPRACLSELANAGNKYMEKCLATHKIQKLSGIPSLCAHKYGHNLYDIDGLPPHLLVFVDQGNGPQEA